MVYILESIIFSILSDPAFDTNQRKIHTLASAIKLCFSMRLSVIRKK